MGQQIVVKRYNLWTETMESGRSLSHGANRSYNTVCTGWFVI